MRPSGLPVATFRLTSAAARTRVRELAADSANIIWTNHVQQRMVERSIDSDAVLRILRSGEVDAEPEPGQKLGDWKIKLTRQMPTGRFAGVVTVLVANSRLVLLTTEWEDRR